MTVELGHVAIGTWSGGRYLHYGVELGDEELRALLRPGADIDTAITADAYGAGAADALLGEALAGLERASYRVVGAVGHDVEAPREGPKGYPRFTDARLRGPGSYAGYLRGATERSLERLGIDELDVLLLHNPDRTGYESEEVWDGMVALRDAGLAKAIGIAPGPANGFTLDVLRFLERFGDRIDWAMLILNPFEPWPGELALDACAAHDVDVIARVVDYGGLFFDDVRPGHEFAAKDHRLFRPAGWVEAAQPRLDAVRPIAAAHGLSLIQLAAQWDLAHPAVRCVAPTLIQEPGADAVPVMAKRADLAATPRDVVLTDDEVAQIRAIGDNAGSMLLKGATPDHDGETLPDRWALDEELEAAGRRWGVDARADLRRATSPAAGS